MLSRNNDCFGWTDLISSGIKLFCIPVNKVIRATACEQAPYLGDIVKSSAQARAATERRRKSGGREKERRAYNDLCDEFSFPTWKPQETAKRENCHRKQEICQRQLHWFLENKLLHYRTKTRLFPPPLAARFAYPNAGELARRLSRRGWVHKWKCADICVCHWSVVLVLVLVLPAFLDTSLPRGNVHERDSGPMRGAIPTQSHNP